MEFLNAADDDDYCPFSYNTKLLAGTIRAQVYDYRNGVSESGKLLIPENTNTEDVIALQSMYFDAIIGSYLETLQPIDTDDEADIYRKELERLKVDYALRYLGGENILSLRLEPDARAIRNRYFREAIMSTVKLATRLYADKAH